MDPVTLYTLYALRFTTPRESIFRIAEHATAGTTTRNPIDHWQPLIAAAAKRFGIPEAWIGAVMGAESGGRTALNGRPIISSAGAMGLMQIMPGTLITTLSRQ